MQWVLGFVAVALAMWAVAAYGPWSSRARFRREVRQRLARLPSVEPLTYSDLDELPEPVRRYVNASGAVDRPRVRHFRAAWRGRIRSAPDAPWMSFSAEQHNFVDEPARFFRMDAWRGGLPVDVYHAFSEHGATMEAKVLSLFPVAREDGPELQRAETVTMLNDLCVLADGALAGPGLRWQPIDDRSARVHYTVGPHTVSAELRFDEAGQLVDFVSDDRLQSEGPDMVAKRWSTPIGDYRSWGPIRAASRGEGRWHGPEGEWTYIELELVDLDVDSGV